MKLEDVDLTDLLEQFAESIYDHDDIKPANWASEWAGLTTMQKYVVRERMLPYVGLFLAELKKMGVE